MSTNSLAAAHGRYAAVNGEAAATRPETQPELADLAAAIGRIAALLNAEPAGKDFKAIEQIADIAFVLHERDVEASLCDTLDAAVRELSSSAKRAHQALEHLNEIGRRLDEMIAPLQAFPGSSRQPGLELVETEGQGDRRVEDQVPSAVEQLAQLTEPVLGPEDDPGELFEPIPVAAAAVGSAATEAALASSNLPPEAVNGPSAAIREDDAPGAEMDVQPGARCDDKTQLSAVAVETERRGDMPSTAAPTPIFLQPATPPAASVVRPPQSSSRHLPIDPLALLQALSEEEMIALFS